MLQAPVMMTSWGTPWFREILEVFFIQEVIWKNGRKQAGKVEGPAGPNHDTTTIARRKYHGRLIIIIKILCSKPFQNKKGAPPPPGMKHPSNRLMGNKPIKIFYHVQFTCQIFLSHGIGNLYYLTSFRVK